VPTKKWTLISTSEKPGDTDLALSDFYPIAELQNPDADLMLVLLYPTSFSFSTFGLGQVSSRTVLLPLCQDIPPEGIDVLFVDDVFESKQAADLASMST
jgi:hypothetical protein